MATNKKEEQAPQYYYEWGNEPSGMVSTYYYDKTNSIRSTGLMAREAAKKMNLKFNNPYS